MLTSVVLDNEQGRTFEFYLTNPTGGYVVKNIEGLDPVKANIVSTPYALLDGSQAQSSRRESRNIVFDIELVSGYYEYNTVQVMRRELYQAVMPKRFVTIQFWDNYQHYATIRGQVETCEAPLFAQNPSVRISILCFDPDFVSPNLVEHAFETTNDNTDSWFWCDSTVDTGYVLTLNVDRTLGDFTVVNRRFDGTSYSLNVLYDFEDGDVVEISTRPPNKYIHLYRDSVLTSILYAVDVTSKWSPIFPGDNYFKVSASGAAIPYTISYMDRYGGL
jgi:hypothetical protein